MIVPLPLAPLSEKNICIVLKKYFFLKYIHCTRLSVPIEIKAYLTIIALPICGGHNHTSVRNLIKIKLLRISYNISRSKSSG